MGTWPDAGHQIWSELARFPGRVALLVGETAEELGCDVRLLAGLSAPLPARYPHPAVTAARWTVEMLASPDHHTGEPHVHLDHVFVGLYVAGGRVPETRVRWAGERDVAEAPDLPEDVRMLARELFAEITGLARS